MRRATLSGQWLRGICPVQCHFPNNRIPDNHRQAW
jgi:hypothetical protein